MAEKPKLNEKAKKLLKQLTYDETCDLYRHLRYGNVLEDVRALAEDEGFDVSEAKMESAAVLFVYECRYDCNESYWGNLRSLLEAEMEKIEPGEIYYRAVKVMKPEEIDHYGNGKGFDDLYLKVTPESRKLVKRLTAKDMLSTFRSDEDGSLWYDLPFCYPVKEEDEPVQEQAGSIGGEMVKAMIKAQKERMK